MRSIRSCLFIFSVAALAGSGFAQEWRPLFNGTDLDGWVQRGGDAKYEVKDGAIVGTTAPNQKHNAFLCTKADYQDFELELEFKVDPELNSGVQIRSESRPDFKDGRVHGYQVEIDPSERSYSGAVYDESRRGKFLADLADNEEARKALKQNEWNKLWISARGNQFKTKINGVDAVSFSDDMTSRGFIALQVHSVRTEKPLSVAWRNIKIKDWTEAFHAQWDDGGSPFGDYKGKSGDKNFVAQVVDLGHGEFSVRLKPDFNTKDTVVVLRGSEENGVVKFNADGFDLVLKDDKFTGKDKEGKEISLSKIERKSPTLGAKPPEGAKVLFDGKSLDGWKKADGSKSPWKLTEEGFMEVVPKTGNTESVEQFQDAEYHIEFRTSFMPHGRGQVRANSGVYVMGTYETQVLDSFALEGEDNECGGIYKVGKPLVNMAYPPLSWQTYDITFRAPRFDEGGKKTENARITVKHNGVVIQDNLELPDATGGAKYKGEPNHPAPLVLQEHSNPIQYRNIWVKPINN